MGEDSAYWFGVVTITVQVPRWLVVMVFSGVLGVVIGLLSESVKRLFKDRGDDGTG